MKLRILICLFLFISLRGYSQCTLTVTLSQSSPAICSGTGVLLTATPKGGTPPYSYSWSTGETNASITVNKEGTYTVSVSDKTPGCAPVKQNITIVAGTTPDAPTAKKAIVCSGSPATLTATAPGAPISGTMRRVIFSQAEQPMSPGLSLQQLLFMYKLQ